MPCHAIQLCKFNAYLVVNALGNLRPQFLEYINTVSRLNVVTVSGDGRRYLKGFFIFTDVLVLMLLIWVWVVNLMLRKTPPLATVGLRQGMLSWGLPSL